MSNVTTIISTSTNYISGYAPLSLTINPSAINASDYPIIKLEYDFQDGSDSIIVKRELFVDTAVASAYAYPADGGDPRNIIIEHDFYPNIVDNPTIYDLKLKVTKANTFSPIEYDIVVNVFKINTLNSLSSLGYFEDIHLLKTRVWGESNSELFTLETINPRYLTNLIFNGTILPTPFQIVTQPLSLSGIQGDTLSLNISAISSDLITYQWQWGWDPFFTNNSIIWYNLDDSFSSHFSGTDTNILTVSNIEPWFTANGTVSSFSTGASKIVYRCIASSNGQSLVSNTGSISCTFFDGIYGGLNINDSFHTNGPTVTATMSYDIVGQPFVFGGAPPYTIHWYKDSADGSFVNNVTSLTPTFSIILTAVGVVVSKWHYVITDSNNVSFTSAPFYMHWYVNTTSSFNFTLSGGNFLIAPNGTLITPSVSSDGFHFTGGTLPITVDYTIFADEVISINQINPPTVSIINDDTENASFVLNKLPPLGFLLDYFMVVITATDNSGHKAFFPVVPEWSNF